MAGSVLGLSVWKSADEQAYAQVVPEAVQEAMKAEESEQSRGVGNESDWNVGNLPGDMRYIISVASKRLQLLVVRDPVEQVRLRMEFADERLQTASQLMAEGKTSKAIKTANKGVHYLQYAWELWQATEMSEQERAELGGTFYAKSNDHEQMIHTFKEEVLDLAEPSVDELCEKLMMIRDATKDYQ